MSRANDKPTLHISRNGSWCVSRPHATGFDIGPACYARLGDRIPDTEVQVQIDWYTRAGFHIEDKRKMQP